MASFAYAMNGDVEFTVTGCKEKNHEGENQKHFLITLAGKEKRFLKATYMLQELLAKWPKSKRPKVRLVLD